VNSEINRPGINPKLHPIPYIVQCVLVKSSALYREEGVIWDTDQVGRHTDSNTAGQAKVIGNKLKSLHVGPFFCLFSLPLSMTRVIR
jgi:hypothetical protein